MEALNRIGGRDGKLSPPLPINLGSVGRWSWVLSHFRITQRNAVSGEASRLTPDGQAGISTKDCCGGSMQSCAAMLGIRSRQSHCRAVSVLSCLVLLKGQAARHEAGTLRFTSRCPSTDPSGV